ncbi:hypothetical protein EBESD8_46810 [Rhodococcus aetherivorans]|nr:hypothetical protein EBESD8_46810 [Rhodococcus aetherivorans]
MTSTARYHAVLLPGLRSLLFLSLPDVVRSGPIGSPSRVPLGDPTRRGWGQVRERRAYPESLHRFAPPGAQLIAYHNVPAPLPPVGTPGCKSLPREEMPRVGTGRTVQSAAGPDDGGHAAGRAASAPGGGEPSRGFGDRCVFGHDALTSSAHPATHSQVPYRVWGEHPCRRPRTSSCGGNE